MAFPRNPMLTRIRSLVRIKLLTDELEDAEAILMTLVRTIEAIRAASAFVATVPEVGSVTSPVSPCSCGPLIIAGGHACYNPEPMADFIDAFVIGEGEEVMIEALRRGFAAMQDVMRAQNEMRQAVGKPTSIQVLRGMASCGKPRRFPSMMAATRPAMWAMSTMRWRQTSRRTAGSS